MVIKGREGWLLLFGCWLLIGLACAAPTLPTINDVINKPAQTPTPVGDSLQFDIVTRYGLSPGELVPGTRLEYVGKNDAGDFQVRIDGQNALKQNLDSFFWNGVVAPGVIGNYSLRIGEEVLGELQVGGPVKLIVLNQQPSETTAVPSDDSSITFKNIIINYYVPVGWTVPGTTITYDGVSQQGGNTLAQLSGFSGYPLLAVGDSLTWTGTLLSNVTIRYNLRVLALDEEGMRLDGTAEIWVQR